MQQLLLDNLVLKVIIKIISTKSKYEKSKDLDEA